MTLHVECRGAGPDVVLIHGWGLDGSIWDTTAAWLAPRFRLWVVDLPGHGLSPLADARAFQLDAVADAVRAAVPPGAVWVGWSLGALVAMAAAVTGPHAVARLALVAGTPRFTCAPDWPYGIRADVLDTFAADLERDYEGTLNRFLSLQTRGSAAARATLRTLRRRPVRHAPALDALRGGLALLRDTDLRARLHALSVETLVLAGGRDTLVPAAASQALARALPRARIEMFPEAGHVPFLSHPAAFHAALEGLLHG
ncbi:MAG: pimeloyl-[acyl-carrier protein] methyl ester esterase [Chromatiales bacterium 21-64-14]|nr:MAG: pimeloyl-[acyl-carrier protein] methyl ester esterase [Chromatiales bacterium 21-64-14]HQU17065.1 pimeloyl-ACP methyl ester esterase BioH [Gammaproteobacteria bacterium]